MREDQLTTVESWAGFFKSSTSRFELERISHLKGVRHRESVNTSRAKALFILSVLEKCPTVRCNTLSD